MFLMTQATQKKQATMSSKTNLLNVKSCSINLFAGFRKQKIYTAYSKSSLRSWRDFASESVLFIAASCFGLGRQAARGLVRSRVEIPPILNTITLDNCVANKQINIYKFIF